MVSLTFRMSTLRLKLCDFLSLLYACLLQMSFWQRRRGSAIWCSLSSSGPQAASPYRPWHFFWGHVWKAPPIPLVHAKLCGEHFAWRHAGLVVIIHDERLESQIYEAVRSSGKRANLRWLRRTAWRVWSMHIPWEIVVLFWLSLWWRRFLNSALWRDANTCRFGKTDLVTGCVGHFGPRFPSPMDGCPWVMELHLAALATEAFRNTLRQLLVQSNDFKDKVVRVEMARKGQTEPKTSLWQTSSDSAKQTWSGLADGYDVSHLWLHGRLFCTVLARHVDPSLIMKWYLYNIGGFFREVGLSDPAHTVCNLFDGCHSSVGWQSGHVFWQSVHVCLWFYITLVFEYLPAFTLLSILRGNQTPAQRARVWHEGAPHAVWAPIYSDLAFWGVHLCAIQTSSTSSLPGSYVHAQMRCVACAQLELFVVPGRMGMEFSVSLLFVRGSGK